MSNYAAFECCVVFLALLIFHKTAEANDYKDWNLVLHTYNPTSDPCAKLPENPALAAKEAADSACWKAFEALDRLKQNYCSGWRAAECRKLAEHDHQVCSCLFSSCTLYGIKINGLASFRDCAWNIYSEEAYTKQTPVPSANFRRKHQQIYDDAKEKSRRGKVARTSYEAGPSHVPRAPRSKGRHGGVGSRGSSSWYAQSPVLAGSLPSAGTSRDAGTLHGAGTSLGAGTSRGVGISRGTGPSHGAGPSVNLGGAQEGSYGSLMCNICGKTYHHRYSLMAHKYGHEEDLQCKLCTAKLATKSNYLRHMETAHGQTYGDSASVPIVLHEVPGGQFACNVCGQIYHHKDSLSAHKRTHREDMRCYVCKSHYSTKSNYKKHMESTHPEIAKVEAAKAAVELARRQMENQYQCETCGVRFKNKKTLQEHKPMHTGETYCAECDQIFSRKVALKIHNKKIHNIPY